MTSAALGALLRLCDSAFPSGAFSHSFGLETAIASGRVVDEASLFTWLDAYLVDGWATLEGAALVLAMRDGVDATELDAVVTAATHASEIRAANARITRSAFDTFGAMGCGDARLAAYRRSVSAGGAHGVPALAFALAYASLGIAWDAAFIACATSTLTALAAVGTRAIPLGQRATARALWALRDSVEAALRAAGGVAAANELCAQAFPQEIDAFEHRRLDGRLFAS